MSDTDATLFPPTSFTVSNNQNLNIGLVIEALTDGLDEPGEIVAIQFDCYELEDLISTAKKSIKIQDVQAEAIRDPHFIQKVFDQKDKSYKYVLYDVTGKSGDVIFLLNDNGKSGLSVYAQFLDDYYLHTTKFVSPDCNISVATTGIKLSDGKFYEWGIKSTINTQCSNELRIKIKGNTVEIQSNFKQFIKLSVKRCYRYETGYFLNIYINHLEDYSKTLNGLFAYIGKSLFQFNEPIQANSRAAVAFNNKLLSSEKRRCHSKICWYLNLQKQFPDFFQKFIHHN